MSWCEQIAAIETVIMDIDGVLTDGRLAYSDNETTKVFHARDGHAIKLALRAGLRVGALSGRDDAANRRRLAELGFSFAYLGERNKAEAFQRLLREQGLSGGQCLYIGDDVVDIPVLREAGIGVAVADAPPEVKAAADWITARPGGHEAVREVLVEVLRQQGRWDQVMARYLSPAEADSACQ